MIKPNMTCSTTIKITIIASRPNKTASVTWLKKTWLKNAWLKCHKKVLTCSGHGQMFFQEYQVV